MSRFGSTDDREGVLPPRVARAVELLREEPEVPVAWRDDLVRSATTLHSRRPWLSAAAAVLAAGVCAAVALGHDRGARSTDGTRGAFGETQRGTAVAALAATAPETAPVRFTVEAPNAAHVSLVGDFEGWNPAGVPMSLDADGHTWTVDVRLAPGRHAFVFSVDGGLRVDPRAPMAGDDDFGTPSSVIVVPQSGEH